MCDISDELEPRRVCNVCVDGLLGGSAGEACEVFVFVRVGKAGGARRPAGASAISRAGVAVDRRGSAGTESLSCGREGREGL